MSDIIIKDKDGNEIPSRNRFILATLAAIGGALIGMGIWVGLAALNWVASVAALTICYFANKFYNLARGPQTKAKFWIIFAITIITLLISEYLALYVQLVLSDLGGVTFAKTLVIVFKNFNAFVFDFIIFIAFAILGCAASLAQIYREVYKTGKVKVNATNFDEKSNDAFEEKFKEFEENSKDKFEDK